jgi:glycosyltransferase involved in cell wall biosynthesis
MEDLEAGPPGVRRVRQITAGDAAAFQPVTGGPVLLASGLPLRDAGQGPPTSFQRQLALLAGGFRRAGREAHVVGPLQAGQASGAPAILLGYPDQFPALQAAGPSPPLYLWAQCSRPPDPRAYGQARAVPLTPLTAAFLARAGVPRPGPVIPHAVDTAVFRPLTVEERARARRALGLEACFAVGAVGANSYRKRFDLILAAFALFAAGRQEARLLIKTDRAVSKEGRSLIEWIERFRLEDRVRVLTAELSEAGMRDLYGALDVLVNLSEWEGFGLPVAEAMSCGLPVVTHRVQGPGELLPYAELLAEDSEPYEEGGSLLLQARPRTVAGLLARASADPDLRLRAAELGRQEVQRRCALGAVVERWLELFRTDRG